MNSLDASYKQNVDNFSYLKQLEADCKSTENLLLSKQADLRSIKLIYQNFTQITGLFSKDLHQFIFKLKNPSFKRTTNDLESDLSHTKSCLNEADEKYQFAIQKINLLKDSLCQLVENQKQLTNAYQKCELSLKESECKLNTDINRFESVKLCDDVKQLQDACDLFTKHNEDILSNKKLIDDVKKFTQNLFLNLNNFDLNKVSIQTTHAQRIVSLEQRYDQLENMVKKQINDYVDKMAYSKNLKENYNSIQNWLINVENNLNNESPISNIDDKINSLTHLKQDLETRKDYLIQNLSPKTNSQHREQLERYNNLLDNINKQRDSLTTINELLQNFETSYVELDEFCKKNACRIDELNPFEKNESNYDSTISLLGDINFELKSKSKQLKSLESLLNIIDIKVQEGKLSKNFDLSSLNEDIIEMQINFEQLNSIINAKVNEFVLLNNMKQKYGDIKAKSEKWLKVIERQYNELENLLDLYRVDGKIVMDKLNEIASQYLAFLSKQHFNGEKVFLNSNIEIENEVKKLNDLYEHIGECLDERRHDVLSCLDKMKSYLQDLHRLDSLLNEYDLKLSKIFTYSPNDANEDILNTFPMSRMILTHIIASVKKLGADINTFNNDIEKFKVKSKQFIFDRVTNDQNGIDDIKKQLKELVDKYASLNNHYLERKEKCELHFNNFDSYEKLRDEFKQNLELKIKSLETLTLSDDLKVIDSQIQQIDALRSDLINQDYNKFENLHRNSELLRETSFKRDSNFVKLEIEKLKEKYDNLVANCSSLINYKQQIKDSCSSFGENKLKFYENLNKVDARLNELASMCSQSPDLIIHELNQIENESLIECHNLLLATNDCLPTLSNTPGVITEESKQSLIHMKTAFNNTVSNLNSLKQNYESILTKDNVFNSKISELTHFIEDKLNSPLFNELISANYDRVQKQRQRHAKFHFEIEQRRDDVKNLVGQAHNEMNNNKSDSIKHELTQKIQTVEISWNTLIAKSNNLADKLNVCYELAEQFNVSAATLSQWLKDVMSEKISRAIDHSAMSKVEIEKKAEVKEDVKVEKPVKKIEKKEIKK